MNGARSIFMHKGYWLTALAAAVLLAASPGTASAQSIGFVGTSSTMMEGASADAKTPAPITIDINVSGLTAPSDGNAGDLETGLGMLTLVHDADTAYPGQDARTADNRRIWLDSKSSAIDEAELAGNSDLNAHTDADKAHLYGVMTGVEINYDNNGVIKLVIIDPDGDGNWGDNKFTMDLRTQQAGVSPSPGSHTVTVTDTSPQPTVSFSKTYVALTEGTQTTMGNPVSVKLGVPARMTAPSCPLAFFCSEPRPTAVDSADWVRLVLRVSTAVQPRRSARPLSGPGRLTKIGCSVAAPSVTRRSRSA